jgi:hypothetical protein
MIGEIFKEKITVGLNQIPILREDLASPRHRKNRLVASGVQIAGELIGKTICTKDKVFKMVRGHSEKENSSHYKDLTEEGSRREDEISTSIARKLESDDVNEENSSGAMNDPSGDRSAEKKVATSIDDD